MLLVVKRNGDKVEFDSSRIITAINKAAKEVYNKDEEPWYAAQVAADIKAVAIENEEPLTVEQIQELVEDYLSDYDRLVGKAYIRYRYKRGVMRSCSNEFIRSISE